jgi:DNA polymerase-3 subunit alpha
VVVIEGEIYEREGFDRPMARLTKAFNLMKFVKNVPKYSNSSTQDLMTKTLAKIYKNLLPFCNVDMCQHPVQMRLNKAMRQLNCI